ncbi:DUF397 domain-containing protein [Streptomyces rameus]
MIVRETKRREGAHLSLNPASWSRFIEATKQASQ